MFQLARNAVNFIFAGNKVKQELEQVFDLAAKTLEFWWRILKTGTILTLKIYIIDSNLLVIEAFVVIAYATYFFFII